MKISPTTMYSNVKNSIKHVKVNKGLALAVPLIASAREASAHTSPFFHMHDVNGNTIGMGAGVLMFVGAAVATGVAIYRRTHKNEAEEKINKNQ